MKSCEWCGKEINKEYGKLKYSIKIWCKQKVKEVYFCCYNCKSKFIKENELKIVGLENLNGLEKC